MVTMLLDSAAAEKQRRCCILLAYRQILPLCANVSAKHSGSFHTLSRRNLSFIIWPVVGHKQNWYGTADKIRRSISYTEQWMDRNNRHILSCNVGGQKCKPRCCQGHALSSISRGKSFLAYSGFCCLPAILGIPWLVDGIFESYG